MKDASFKDIGLPEEYEKAIAEWEEYYDLKKYWKR
ncbi:MAG: hypothetical protein HW383_451 [Candidatus Magasanikbacteria bacterium]|nr:hypothetical protein [Candidatus Magasanikbacteria bacterium]